MRIDHIALWTNNLEELRTFYQHYFHMKCGDKYENLTKGFSSYFLSFESGSRIEIMTRKDISTKIGIKGISNGLTHLAISVGNKEKVIQLIEQLRTDGFEIIPILP